MTGLPGLELTSADGAQLRLTPHSASRMAQFVGDGPGQRGVVDRAERQVAGEGGAVPHFEAGDVAALLVDGDEHVVPLGPELGGERGELLGRLDVAAEQADGGQTFADPAQQPLGRRGAREAGLQDGEGVAGDGVRAGNEGGHGGVIPSRRRR